MVGALINSGVITPVMQPPYMCRDVARIFGLGGYFRLKFEPTFFEAKKKFPLHRDLSTNQI